MTNNKIKISLATSTVGPYSQAIRVKNFLFVSGQIPIDHSGKIVNGDIRVQTKQVINNLRTVVEKSGMSLNDIVKCSCFLKNMDDFSEFNSIYSEYFSSILPARECVEVARLPKDVLIEISAIAVE